MSATGPYQPASVGGLLVRTLRVCGANFKVLVILTVLLAMPVQIAAWGVQMLTDPRNLVAVVAFSIGQSVLGIAATSYFYAAAAIVVTLDLSGARAGVVQVVRHLRGRLAVEMAGTMLLLYLIVIGWYALMVVPFVLVTVLTKSNLFALLLALVCTLVGFALLSNRVVRYLFVSPVLVLEHFTYRRALDRSSDLVSGRWWSTFGALIIMSVAGAIIVVLAQLVTGQSWTDPATLGSPGAFGALVRNLLLMAILGPFSLVFLVLMYYDLRARKETNVGIMTEFG